MVSGFRVTGLPLETPEKHLGVGFWASRVCRVV